MRPPAPAAHGDRARHRRGRGARSRDFAEQATRTSTVTVLRCANVPRPGRATPSLTPAVLGLPVVPMILGFDPRYQFVHEDDVVHALEHAVVHDLAGHLQRRRRRRARALGGRSTCSASRRCRSCRRGARAWPPRRCGALGVRIPPEMLQPAALRPRRSTTARSRRPASTTATRRARPCIKLREHHAARADPARAPSRSLPLRARGRGVPALEPARAPRGAREPPARRRGDAGELEPADVVRRSDDAGARRRPEARLRTSARAPPRRPPTSRASTRPCALHEGVGSALRQPDADSWLRAGHRSRDRRASVLIVVPRRRGLSPSLRATPTTTRQGQDRRGRDGRRGRRRRADARRRRAPSSSAQLLDAARASRSSSSYGARDLDAHRRARLKIRADVDGDGRRGARRAAATAAPSGAPVREATGGDGRRHDLSPRSPTPKRGDRPASSTGRARRRPRRRWTRPIKFSATGLDDVAGPATGVARRRRARCTARSTPSIDRARRPRRTFSATTTTSSRRSRPTTLAAKYPALPHRRPRRLQADALCKNLKLAKTYTVAVGQQGLETPAGLYHIQNKAVNPAWNVPNSRVGRRASPARSIPRGARATRSRRAGWGSSTAPASTASTERVRLASARRLARLRADARSRTSRTSTRGPGRRADLHRLSPAS